MGKWVGERNESIYERFSMVTCSNGVKSGVVEWMKRNTLRWFGHIESMKNEEFVKKVYFSESDVPSRRGRPLERWKDRVKNI